MLVLSEFTVPDFVWVAVAGVLYALIEVLKAIKFSRIDKNAKATNDKVQEIQDTAARTHTEVAETKAKVESVERKVRLNRPSHPRILIVDDDDKFRELLKDELMIRGFSAMGVDTKKGAVDQLKKENVDLVIVDLSLPDENGNRLITRLAGARDHAPIIVLTGFPELLKQEAAQHVAGVLAKPVELNDLVCVIDQALRHEPLTLPSGGPKP